MSSSSSTDGLQESLSRKRSVETAAAEALVDAPDPTASSSLDQHDDKDDNQIPPSKMARTSTPPTTTTTTTAGGLGNNTAEKAYKGLRHFSMMVCKKVEEKGTTTYNQVADELVLAVVEQRRSNLTPSASPYDEKNIRRRVYDALNVLMAMDIIAKDKKEITWKGLPTAAAQDAEMLLRELDYRTSQVRKKQDALAELLVQQVSFRNLLQHNQRRELQEGVAVATAADNKIPLPFIVVNTHSSAVIQCNMSRDLTDVMFDFSMPFEINDDNTILKRLGMYVVVVAVCLTQGRQCRISH
jgi:transcription factor Dp-1